MPLRLLPPVLAASIADDRLTYEWDEWDVQEYFDFPDDVLEARLAEVSGRGAIALTLAVGEWICQRYAKLNSDPAPLQYLEAAWAEQMQPDSAYYVETDDDEWRGLVRGPLSLVITIANDALFALDEDEDTPTRAAWMTNLARHVLPSTDEFEAWLEIVLELLTIHHPKQSSQGQSLAGDELGLGRPVARELFDTLRGFIVGNEATWIQQFLGGVDPQNPFLAVNAPAD